MPSRRDVSVKKMMDFTFKSENKENLKNKFAFFFKRTGILNLKYGKAYVKLELTL